MGITGPRWLLQLSPSRTTGSICRSRSAGRFTRSFSLCGRPCVLLITLIFSPILGYPSNVYRFSPYPRYSLLRRRLAQRRNLLLPL